MRIVLPSVLLHPDEAAQRGIGDGRTVALYNDHGRLKLTVHISDDVPIGVALVHEGRGPEFDPNNANINILNPADKSYMGETSCGHSIEAAIELLTTA
jgi:anaerobic selenocysteine-containing dehydrogenase